MDFDNFLSESILRAFDDMAVELCVNGGHHRQVVVVLSNPWGSRPHHRTSVDENEQKRGKQSAEKESKGKQRKAGREEGGR